MSTEDDPASCFVTEPPRSRPRYGFFTYSSAPDSTNSVDFAARCSRTSSEIFIEQNFGPHIEQKWATFAPSAGSVSS